MKAIFINSESRNIHELDIPTRPAPKGSGAGPQICLDTVRGILDCELLDFVALPNGSDVLIVDDEGLLKDPTSFFEIAGGRIAGSAVLIGHDLETDSFGDVHFSAATVEKMLSFSSGRVAGFDTTVENNNIIVTPKILPAQ